TAQALTAPGLTRANHRRLSCASSRATFASPTASNRYPPMDLSKNVPYLYPRERAAFFYTSNTATLSLTRDAMHRRGRWPASRLFEAATCGGPWPALEDVLEPDAEVLLADSRADALKHLTVRPRAAIGQAAHVPDERTFAHRAAQLEHTQGQWANAY